MRIHALVNYSIADLGIIGKWAQKKGHTITTTAVYENIQFPDVDQVDMLVILGGVVGAYEEEANPWLRNEKEFIKEVIQEGKVVLGICLGAQMIAEAIGGKAYSQKYEEIGWWDVRFAEKIKSIPVFKNLPTEIMMFQYHGDTYELPSEAVWLAESEGCANQAFLFKDRVVGLQFHPEFNEAKLQEIVSIHGHEIKKGKYTQTPEEFLGKKDYLQKAESFLFTLLNNLEEKVGGFHNGR